MALFTVGDTINRVLPLENWQPLFHHEVAQTAVKTRLRAIHISKLEKNLGNFTAASYSD